MAERMADYFVGFHPTMPGSGKSAQAVDASRCLKYSAHASMMTTVRCPGKTKAAATSTRLRSHYVRYWYPGQPSWHSWLQPTSYALPTTLRVTLLRRFHRNGEFVPTQRSHTFGFNIYEGIVVSMYELCTIGAPCKSLILRAIALTA